MSWQSQLVLGGLDPRRIEGGGFEAVVSFRRGEEREGYLCVICDHCGGRSIYMYLPGSPGFGFPHLILVAQIDCFRLRGYLSWASRYVRMGLVCVLKWGGD